MMFKLVFFAFLLCVSTYAQASDSIFVIGQDVGSITDYVSSLPKYRNSLKSFPDGFMIYTAINDLRGLKDSVVPLRGVIKDGRRMNL